MHVVDDIKRFLLQIKEEEKEVLLVTYGKEHLEIGELLILYNVMPLYTIKMYYIIIYQMQ
mgnify:CR=1 FL=1